MDLLLTKRRRMGRARLGKKEELRFPHINLRCLLDILGENLRMLLGMQV